MKRWPEHDPEGRRRRALALVMTVAGAVALVAAALMGIAWLVEGQSPSGVDSPEVQERRRPMLQSFLVLLPLALLALLGAARVRSEIRRDAAARAAGSPADQNS